MIRKIIIVHIVLVSSLCKAAPQCSNVFSNMSAAPLLASNSLVIAMASRFGGTNIQALLASSKNLNLQQFAHSLSERDTPYELMSKFLDYSIAKGLEKDFAVALLKVITDPILVEARANEIVLQIEQDRLSADSDRFRISDPPFPYSEALLKELANRFFGVDLGASLRRSGNPELSGLSIHVSKMAAPYFQMKKILTYVNAKGLEIEFARSIFQRVVTDPMRAEQLANELVQRLQSDK